MTTKAFDRSNRITGDIIDAEVPQNWIIDNLVVNKDMSVAGGFRIELPPYFTMDEGSQESFHQGLVGFLNTLDTKFDLQFLWEVHRETDDIVAAFKARGAKMRLMQSVQDEIVERIQKDAKAQRLRRYRAYIILVHKPLFTGPQFANRAKKLTKERKRTGVWVEDQDTGGMLSSLFSSSAPPYALQYEQAEWDQIKESLLSNLGILENTLDSLHLSPKYLYDQDLADLLYEWWNPNLAQAGVKCAELSPTPMPISDYFVLSPIHMDRKAGYLHMDSSVHRILTVRTPPTDMDVNTFYRLLDQSSIPNLRIVSNLTNYSTEKRINDLQGNLPLLEGRVDKEPRLQVVVDQIKREILRLQAGDESSWAMTTILQTWGKTQEEVDNAALEVKRIGRLSGNATIVQEEYALWGYWLAAQPFWTRDQDQHRMHLYTASQVGCVLPLSGHPEQIENEPIAVLMETANGSLFNFNLMDQKRLNNYNTLIMGSSGTGKSFLAGSIILGMQPVEPRVIVIDLGGSYKSLCEALGGEYITMDPNSRTQTINPLYVNPTANNEPISPTDKNQIIRFLEKALLEADEVFDKKYESQVDQVLSQLFLQAAGKEVFLSQLRDAFQKFGTDETKDLASRMSMWCSAGQYGNLYDGPTRLDFNKSFVVFDLSAVKDNKAVAPLTIMSIMQNVRQMAMNYPNQPKLLLMDEAWFLLQDKASSRYIGEAFRTYRKLNVAIIGVSQGISEWLIEGRASEVLLNVSNFLILPQTDPSSVQTAAGAIGLNMEEVGIIPQLRKVVGEYSQLLFVQKREAKKFSTVLVNRTTPLQYAIMTTHPDDKRKIEAIRQELGVTPLDARLEFARRYPKGAVKLDT